MGADETGGSTGGRGFGPAPSPAAAGPRQLVVCCDGTNNTLTGGVKDTNVVQLFELLQRHRAAHPESAEQLLYYDPGVGSPVGLPPSGPSAAVSGLASRVGALALGRGIYDNIGQAYLQLCREYGRQEPPGAAATTDEIYLFGFSRGAFQVRAVAGMVNLFGLIRPEHEPLLPTLLRVYFAGRGATASAGEVGPELVTRALEGMRVALDRQPSVTISGASGRGVDTARLTRGDVAEQIRTTCTAPIGAQARVHFVGVWDTVESVGLPGFRKRITSSRSIEGKRMTHVRHALALDEHRRQFLPRYYAGPVSEGQTLRQLWFRGVHTDIGGSRPFRESRMSSETLRWMIDEAIDCGLRCPRVEVPASPPVEVIGDQLRAQPLWALTGMAVRDPAGSEAGTAPSPGGPPFDREPREHPSVERLSPGDRRQAPENGPRNPWEAGNGPRLQAWLIPLLAVLAAGTVSLLAAGACITPGPLRGQVGASLEAGAGLLWDQLTHLWWPGTAQNRFAGWAPTDGAESGRSPGWALTFLLGAAAAVIAVVARVVARAFGRLTMWRRVTDRPPGRLLTLLGLALPALAIGWAVQGVGLVVAWGLGATPLRWAALVVSTAGWLGVVFGLLACVALVLLWIWGEGSGRVRRTRVQIDR